MKRSIRVAGLLVVLGGLGGTVFAQEPETSGERWIEAHRDGSQKPYFGQLINLSLKDADLVEVLRSFAEIGGFNLVIQPGVKGTVTVELHGVPWDQALEQILKINNLGMDVSTGKVSIGPGSDNPWQSFAASMVTVRLDLRYADAEVVARALARPAADGRSPGGMIRAEGGTLVARDTRPVLRRLGRVLTAVDVPEAAQEDPASLELRCVELWDRSADPG